MRVEPDQVLRLKHDLEDIRRDARYFVEYETAAMTPLPMGADPVSHDVAETVGRNADTAITCMKGYLDELTAVIDSLARTAHQYGLNDDTAAEAFRGPGA
jgi:hypothetical protein